MKKTLKEIAVETETGKQTLQRSKVALNQAPKGNCYNCYGENLYSVYDKPSDKKINADKDVQALIKALNGYAVAYCGNTFTFSVGFRFRRDGVTYQAYITACNNRFYPIGE